MQNLSYRDPATAAAAWLEAMPAGPSRDSATQNVVNGWSQNDPQGASNKWLDTLPAGKAREQAAESFINQVSYPEPALAAKWVMELAAAGSHQPGPNNRNSYRVENLARTWLQQDEKAARAWIQQAPLSGECKRVLLEPKREKKIRLKGPQGKSRAHSPVVGIIEWSCGRKLISFWRWLCCPPILHYPGNNPPRGGGAGTCSRRWRRA